MMNTTIANQQQDSISDQHGAVQHNPPDALTNETMRKTHLTKFAFLFSAARSEGSREAVIGMNHDVEMAACFSKRHHTNQPLGGGSYTGGDSGGIIMPITPPSISSSLLSMHSKNNIPGPQNENKNSLLEMAAMNMSTPFYTTPDTVSSTAKTVLTNVVSTMEELMDSRLRSTVSQLVKRGSTTSSSSSNQLLFLRLLSPSRNPIQVGTVITRFVLPEMNNDNGENILGGTTKSTSTYSSSTNNDMVSIPLVFMATIDVKVFGQMNTVELNTPVTMTGKFDNIDDNSEATLLLNAVDVSFDCTTLLQNMISQARIIVKMAVTKAAELSVQISEYMNKKTSNKNKSIKKATSSLLSLVGGSVSSGSLNSLFSASTNFLALTANNDNNKMKKPRLLRNPLFSNNGTDKLDHPSYSTSLNDNANATFDLGGGVNNNTNLQQQYQVNDVNSALGNRTASTISVVRFQMPVDTSKNQAQQQQQHPREEDQTNNKGNNIHAGLFSWLQEDSMFLSEEKIEEQNKADEERERKRREAPQPLRFFTAAEDPEMVSKSIFGNGAEQQQNGEDHRDKRRKV